MVKRYYHMIVQCRGDWTGETRKEYISTCQGAAPSGYVCVGVCGYHDKEVQPKNKKAKENIK